VDVAPRASRQCAFNYGATPLHRNYLISSAPNRENRHLDPL
jgi:hypothetical protein